MRGLLIAGIALCCAVPAQAADLASAKLKPVKYSWKAEVDTETAITCMLENNSLNVQTLRRQGYVDMVMYVMWARMAVVTITPQDRGVLIEARGQMARDAQIARPCMGLPAAKGRFKLG